ncbi:hypothetical protein AF335_08545 [Streptomyces eurocidicus]|uniref:Secreted protein n=1 Tax=Streptomyces eurocidicus TaxID=66423 RepID=A0A2N8P0Q2_STREU|nr:hypothetical protein [Streptomyces eurocidicus]MBB5122075.1 hypothetical protein [Streptomyces eurocidicus]MBF6055408.1 hypothetical protein [Streptomyces eurocidicus]PNE34591.1 hypothetical protein AF335_08545 [Streptomyces eurocidicus]
MKRFRLPVLVVALVFTVGAIAASAWVHGTEAPAPSGAGTGTVHSQVSVASGRSFALVVNCSAGQDPARGADAPGTGPRRFVTTGPPSVTTNWSMSSTDVSTSRRDVRAVAICATP